MAFATTQDVADRMGRTLTDAEEATAELVIELVTGLIAAEAGQDDAWAAALTPVPTYLRALCIAKSVMAIVNSDNVAAMSRSLGAYSESRTFPRASDGDMVLSAAEGRMVRWAVYGSTVATPRAYSGPLYDILGS